MNIDHQPKIIEFYGNVVDENDEVVESLEFLCNPGIKLPKKIVQITGITDEMLADQPPFSECAENLAKFIESCDAVAAHNLSFDWAMVNNEMKRCGMKVEWPLTRICTVENTEWIKGHRLKLAELYEYLFEEEFKDAHRAKSDVDALTKCFIELRKRGDL